MVNPKMRTDVSVLYENTGASVTTETRISRKKNNMKSLAMSPPRKGMIPNPDINMLGTKTDQSISSQLAKFLPGFK